MPFFRMLMAAIGTPVRQPPARIGSSWRLRTVLLLVALTFHGALFSLIRFDRLVLQPPSGADWQTMTVTMLHPATPSPSPLPSPSPAATATSEYHASRALPAVKPTATTRHTVPQNTTPSVKGLEPSYARSSGASEPSKGVGEGLGEQPREELGSKPDIDRQIDGQLDVENLERQAVLIGQDRNVTFEMPQDRLIHAPNAKEKLTEAVNKAERSDCRSAYAGFGPLAIPFLVENAITGTGCKW